MNKYNKLSGALGTIGVVYGLYYSMKNNKQLGATALFSIGFGLVGMLAGNQLNKFFEND